jgi:gliding motility-associated lipoprotein GldD
MKTKVLIFTLISALFFSCSEEKYTPKPVAFPRIEFPQTTYTRYNLNDCNYSFDLADYAIVKNDPYPAADECWYNIHYPKFQATLHLSYRPIKNRDDLFKVINDSREMVYKHVMRADEIVENYISKDGLSGIFYELDGGTATNAQFFVTDSTNNFLRGSLYFNVKTNQDSIAPVLSFLKHDMLHLVNSLKWNSNGLKK